MTPDPNQGLQFDKAEFKDGGVLQCRICKTAIDGEFYQINGQTVCPACRQRAAAELTGGTSAGRFATAFGAGLLASAAGVFVYWAVARLTGAYWGIVAIAVGWMVGYAVNWGARGKGGLPYQILALVLTYAAITAADVPYMLPRRGAELMDYFEAFGQAVTRPDRSILMWIIIAFGLHQAWQMNRGVKLEISGPFSARQSTPPAAS